MAKKINMYWSNLKQNKCPKCSKMLGFEGNMVFCKSIACGFKISAQKMSVIAAERTESAMGRLAGQESDNDDLF